MKHKLYVFETPKVVMTLWETPDTIPSRTRWDSQMYYHPDVVIFIGKMSCVKARNHRNLDYAILLALQEAHMSVQALRKEKPKKRKRKKKDTRYIQIAFPFFED